MNLEIPEVKKKKKEKNRKEKKFQMFKIGLAKAEEPEINLPTFARTQSK